MGNAPALILGIALIALTGCAKMQFVEGHGLKPSETVHLVTAPAGAKAKSNYGQECTTPCYLPLLRDRGGEITLSLGGYRTERFMVTSSVSDRQIAQRSTSMAVEAIDPDPLSIGLGALANILDGRGGVMALDERDFEIVLTRLEEGEEDLLAEAEPITGERIPISLSD